MIAFCTDGSRIFRAMVRASGLVPQISVVLGPAAVGAAYGPALTDVVILAPAEPDALARARRITTLLASTGSIDPAAIGPPRDLRALLLATALGARGAHGNIPL